MSREAGYGDEESDVEMDGIVAETVIHAEHLNKLIDGLFSLKGSLRPTLMSAAEGEKAIPLDRLDGRRGYLSNISGAIGFMFFSSRAMFSFNPQPGLSWQIFVSGITEDDAITLMNLAVHLPIQFAFACEWDELVYRNRVDISTSYGVEQAWVGRDVNKYLPSIYWITIIPISRIYDVDGICSMEKDNGITVLRDRYNILIRLHERARDWTNRKSVSIVDEFVNGAVFDKNEVLEHIDGSEDFLSMSHKLAKWP